MRKSEAETLVQAAEYEEDDGRDGRPFVWPDAPEDLSPYVHSIYLPFVVQGSAFDEGALMCSGVCVVQVGKKTMMQQTKRRRGNRKRISRMRSEADDGGRYCRSRRRRC
jgi:hypothetical protein